MSPSSFLHRSRSNAFVRPHPEKLLGCCEAAAAADAGQSSPPAPRLWNREQIASRIGNEIAQWFENDQAHQMEPRGY